MTEASTSAGGSGSGKRRRYVRAAAAAHPLTPLKLDALRLVAESKFLSTPQVAALLGQSPRAARAHLRDLFDLGLLDVVAVPGIALGGNSPFVMAPKLHVPTRAGLQELERMELLPPSAARPASYGPRQYAFLGHELAVRDVLVWLTVSARALGHELTRWDCSAGLEAGSARPDAVFVYDFGGGKVVAGLVEADMGSERATGGSRSDRWAQKLASYSQIYEESGRDTLNNLTGTRRARVVVTVPDPSRAAWVAKRAGESPAGKYVWVAVRAELAEAGADAHAPIWLRPDGSRQPFLPQSGREGVRAS